MLSVITMSQDTPETCSDVPEVISHASDPVTVRVHLVAELQLSSTNRYAEQVYEWFDHNRDVPGMVVNPDGTVDVWVYVN